MIQDKSINAFFSLVKAGLWEESNVDLNINDNVDWKKVYLLAGAQSVVGLVTAGIERFKNQHIPFNLDQELLMQLIGEVQMIEQTNKEMNKFIEKLVEEMRQADIYTLLVKGQGIAQCYERPLWRASGDVDFFLSNENYEKAINFLLPLSSGNKPERLYSKEMGMSILETFGTSDQGRADPWYVEVHGTLRTGLSTRIDNAIDSVQKDVFCGGNVRSWENGKTQVFLPAPDCDVFFVFTHFIKHFYKEGGVSIRQLCDWCRLLWTYKDSLNHELLDSRIRKAGLMAEWKAFAALAVEYLGMPINAMPLYSSDKKWKQKSEKIVAFILEGGEWRRFKDTLAVGKIFPLSTFRFLPGILLSVNWLKIKERLFDPT